MPIQITFVLFANVNKALKFYCLVNIVACAQNVTKEQETNVPFAGQKFKINLNLINNFFFQNF